MTEKQYAGLTKDELVAELQARDKTPVDPAPGFYIVTTPVPGFGNDPTNRHVAGVPFENGAAVIEGRAPSSKRHNGRPRIQIGPSGMPTGIPSDEMKRDDSGKHGWDAAGGWIDDLNGSPPIIRLLVKDYKMDFQWVRTREEVKVLLEKALQRSQAHEKQVGDARPQADALMRPGYMGE